MTGDLRGRFSGTRLRLRRLLWERGIAWVLVAAIGWLLVAGTIDYLFHVSPGMRVLFLASAVTTLLVLAIRYLLRPLAVAVSDLDLALRIERLHPELAESLSATVSFQGSRLSDSLAGSPALRQAVIEHAVKKSEHLAFDEVIDDRSTRRARWSALIVAVLAAAVVLADPARAGVALQRLVHPFGEAKWPKRTRLALVAVPERIAKGDPFTVEVDVNGVVPSRVELLFRFEDGQMPAPTLMVPTNESAGRMAGTLPAAMQPLHFLVRGGDAETDWIFVDVIPAPDVESLAVTVTPPAYTQLPPVQYPLGRGHIESVVGTKVRVLAESNKPIVQGRLVWQNGEPTEGAVGEDGQTLVAEFPVHQDDSYRVILEDSEGMTNENRSPKPYRVKAIPDAAPVVKLEQPATDSDVTPNALLPIRAIVRDDFGVQDVALRYRVETTQAARQDASNTAPEFEHIPMALEPQTQRWAIDWNLQPLQLSIGSVVVLKVSARDFRDSPGPNVGDSRELHLHVVSEAEFLRQMDGEQRLLREEIDRLKTLQESALDQTRDLFEKAAAASLEDTDWEKLQTTEIVQRRVREKVSESEESIQERVRELLERLAINQVDNLDANKRLALMDSELNRLAEQHLGEVEQALTQARKSVELSKTQEEPPSRGGGSKSDESSDSSRAKSDPKTRAATNKSDPPRPEDDHTASADSKDTPSESPGRKSDAQDNKADATDADTLQSDPILKQGDGDRSERFDSKGESEKTPPNPTAADLSRARDHQEHVVDSLEAMLDQLDEWESVAEVVNDARDLERKQSETAKQVDDAAKQTLGKNEEDLTKEERAALAQAAAKQEELRQQLSRLEQKMSRQADRASESDPAASQAMKDALKLSQESNVGGKMSQAASDIRQNKLADAGQRQGDIAQTLRQLVESLQDRQERELKRLVQDLKQAEKDLDAIRQEQKRLKKEMQDADQIADPEEKKEELARLGRRQESLKKQAEELARRLSRLQAKSASKSSGRAAGRMADAARAMQQGGEEQAQQQQDESLDDLQQAQEELAKARQDAEEALAREQLAKVADSIRDIHRRQVSLKDEVLRLDGIREEHGKWTRGQIQSLIGLSRAESGLAEESAALQERLSEAKVFALVIEEAVEQMLEASGRLSERSSGLDAQRPMDRAARKFAQLLESLRQDQQQNANRGQNNQGEGNGEGGGDAQDGIPGIAQIRLLKELQEEILDETREVAEARTEQGLNEKEVARLEKLSARQGRLADLIRDLTEPEPDDDLPLFPEDSQ